MAWTDPITWVFEQVWSATLFNQQIRDNLNYLKKKPIHRIVITVDQVLASVAWTKITNVDLQIILDMTSDIVFMVNVMAEFTAAAHRISWDVWDVDNAVYLSSGTGTPQTEGIGQINMTYANIGVVVNVTMVFEDIVAGTHNYEIHMLPTVANVRLSHDQHLAVYAVWER